MTRNGEGASSEQIANLIRQCLREGKCVDIDGLGAFVPEGDGFRFEPCVGHRVFIAYVEEDAAAAYRLYADLAGAGFDPWMDRRKLLPGQNWPRAIEDAIDTADFFIACFSTRSIRKCGGFQAEIRYALDYARSLPLDEVFLIPVRLDECPVPSRIRREIQYVDLFPAWSEGFGRLLAVLRRRGRARSFRFIGG